MYSRILSSLALTLTLAVAQADSSAGPQITVTELAPGIHVMMGQGGNIGVSSGADGLFIIDDDMPPLAKKIDAAVRTIRDEPVRMVFNTHWHFDHTGGNEHFGGQGALIVAHDNVRKRLSTEQFSQFTNSTVARSPDSALPVVTFDSTLTFHLNDQTIQAVHIPFGHTDGDSILVFEEANIVHMGDLFFNKMYPVIDISAGGSAWGMIDAIDTAMPYLNDATVIIPGHGQVAGVNELKTFQTMLKTVANRIQLLIDDGKTADEVVALQPTINFDEQWAWKFMPPERFTRLMYASLKATPRPQEKK